MTGKPRAALLRLLTPTLPLSTSAATLSTSAATLRLAVLPLLLAALPLLAAGCAESAQDESTASQEASDEAPQIPAMTAAPELSEVPEMSEVPDVSPEGRWFPVCRGEEAAPRHIVHTALLGQELAVWRADDGTVNAWENRCPHRGVRLSVGTNLGDRLKCRYHGWTYASGSGQCVERPAHPGEKPPSLVRACRFPCAEVDG